MEEREEFVINDTTREIRTLSNRLKGFESPACDGRIKAIVLTLLQEAEMMSLLLIKK